MSSLKVTIDAYAILAVARDASAQEINAAYKRLALKFHPDHAGNTEANNEKIREINEAVEVLRDPKSRGRLDAQLNVNRKRARAPDEFSSSCSGRAKRERRSECPSERQFQNQSQDQSERSWTNHWESNFFPQESYMRSHAAGAGLGEEASKAQEELLKELRKEQMCDRMKRDIIRLMGGSCGPDFDTLLAWVINNSIGEMEADHAKNVRRREEEPRTCNPADIFDSFTGI